jgi:SAM-dependent methyltransferase/uncharacterized protein YbaR (Trm112 family)
MQTQALELLVCPVSQQRLRLSDGKLSDATGSRTYPVVHGVPILADGVTVVERDEKPSPAFIQDMIAALGSHTITADDLQSVFGYKFEFPNLGLQIEADQFIDRVRNAATITDPFTVNLGQIHREPSIEHVHLTLSTQFRIPHVRPSTCFSINASVSNVGEHKIDAEKFPQICIASMWTDLKTKQSVDAADRTHLLVPIQPGGRLTMPLFATSPAKPGRYRLEFSGIIEGDRWLPDGRLLMEIEVTPDAPCLDETNWRCTGVLRDYTGDHVEAVSVLRGWLGKYVSSHKSLVELGGNASPMTRGMARNVINVDIDPFGMIVGSIRDSKAPASPTYIVSDGMNLPFANRSIDAFAMFATFHHFPDPVGLLHHLSMKLDDDGIIALMCEPIGHVVKGTMDDGYRKELLKGVNEQSFAFREYAQMFEDAGLYVADSQIDVGSLKVALKKKPRRFARLKSFFSLPKSPKP